METVASIENNCGKGFNCSDVYSLNFKESIASIIKDNGFLKHTINIKEIDTNNGNYLARLYEVDIKGDTDKGKKEMNLFVKESLDLEKIKLINMHEIFDNEIFIYTNYASVANKLQEDAKIPEHDRFKFVRTYGGNNEIIILDNLSKRGFKNYYRMDVMPIKYAELAIMDMAKFHAISMVVETKMPDYFEKYIKAIKMSYNFDDDWKNYVTNVCINTAKILDGNQEKIINYAPVMKQKLIEYLSTSGKFKNCLSHGDYRMNNVMVKEMDGVAAEVAVVDYQLISYGNPMRDFLYLLYTSSDRKFRLKYVHHLKNTYYNTMTRFLEYFDLDINTIYPREVFEKAYTECRDFGLMMGLCISAFLFIPDNEKLDTSKISLSEIDSANLDIRYKERVEGMIEEFTEWGYL